MASHWERGVRGSCQLLADLLATRPTSLQQVRNKLATSRCNGIWETTPHNMHNVSQRTFARANLLRTCYGETDVADFGLYPDGPI